MEKQENRANVFQPRLRRQFSSGIVTGKTALQSDVRNLGNSVQKQESSYKNSQLVHSGLNNQSFEPNDSVPSEEKLQKLTLTAGTHSELETSLRHILSKRLLVRKCSVNQIFLPDGAYVLVADSESPAKERLLQCHIVSRDEEKQYSLFSNSCDVSILKSFRDQNQFHATSCELTVLDEETIAEKYQINHLRLFFRGRYITQGEFYRMSREDFMGRIFYAKEILFDLNVGTMLNNKIEDMEFGIFSKSTKVARRSLSARIIYLVELNSELFSSSGKNGTYLCSFAEFLQIVFKAWTLNKAQHSVTFIFHGRIGFKKSTSGLEHLQKKHPTLNLSKSSVKSAKNYDYIDIFRPIMQNFTPDSSSGWESLYEELLRFSGTFIKAHEIQIREDESSDGLFLLPSAENNFLEAVNLCLNLLDKHYFDRDLLRTAQAIVSVSAGNGVYRVDKKLARLTKLRLSEFSIGCDIISLGNSPKIHTPLFITEENGIHEKKLAYFLDIAYPFHSRSNARSKISLLPILKKRTPHINPGPDHCLVPLDHGEIASDWRSRQELAHKQWFREKHQIKNENQEAISKKQYSQRHAPNRTSYNRRRWVDFFPNGDDGYSTLCAKLPLKLPISATDLFGESERFLHMRHSNGKDYSFRDKKTSWYRPITNRAESINWEAILAPGTLPLTINYSLDVKNSDSVDFLFKCESYHLTAESFSSEDFHIAMMEIVSQRLSNNFQIAEGETVKHVMNFQTEDGISAEDKEVIVLSMGFTLHSIAFSVSGRELNVQILTYPKKRNVQMNHFSYEYQLYDFLGSYSICEASFVAKSIELDWKSIDSMFTESVSDATNSLEYRMPRFRRREHMVVVKSGAKGWKEAFMSHWPLLGEICDALLDAPLFSTSTVDASKKKEFISKDIRLSGTSV